MNRTFSAQHGIVGCDPQESAGAPTLWALAWSQDEDLIAEQVPYGGDEVPPDSAPRRLRLPALLFGVAASAATIAVSGLVVTLTGTAAQPPNVTAPAANPAVSAPSPRPTVDAPERAGVLRSSPTAPSLPVSRAADVIPGTANVPGRVVNSPAPAITSDSPSTPEATAPQNAEAGVSPAEPTPAEDTAPEVAPQPAPPAIDPPIVSVAVVPPEQVAHPLGPPVFHVPDTAAAPPHPVLVVPPRIGMPAAPAVPNPAIGLPAGTTLPPFAPRMP